MTPFVALNARADVPGPAPKSLEKDAVNGSGVPANDSPGAGWIVMLFDAVVVWPLSVRNGVPTVVVIEPLFQSSAIAGCVSVAGSPFAHAWRLV